jgi:uncharacterized protein (TIGR03905 family)
MCRAFGFLTERAFQITGTCYFYIYSFEAFNISHKLLIGNILLECSCKLVRTGCWLKAAFNSFHKFEGGCSGNTQGVAALVEGMDVNEAIKRMEGIKCGFKPTSCPDQLATALKQYIANK